MSQPTLFDTEWGLAEQEPTRYERFHRFHRENPEVYSLFARYAQEALAAGRSVGARSIGERIRWHTAVETVSDDGYKVNDHYWPYYASLLALTDGRFAEFFTCRGGGSDVTDEQLVRECKIEHRDSV